MSDAARSVERVRDQFSDVPVVRAFFDILFGFQDEIKEAIIAYSTRRFLETAEDVWLDYVGDLIGLRRPYGFVSSGVFTWDSAVSDELWDAGVWSGPGGLRTSTLEGNDDYRQLLRAKAIANRANSSIYDFAQIIEVFDTEYEISVPSEYTVELTWIGAVTERTRYYVGLFCPLPGDTDLVVTN